MRVWILPTIREVQTLYALKNQGLLISTIRTHRGQNRNVADTVPVLTNVVDMTTRKREK